MMPTGLIPDLIVGAFGVLLVAIGALIRWTQVQQAKKSDEQGRVLTEILKQVTATNGRVIALETWRDSHKAEVGRIMGGIEKEFERLAESLDEAWKEIRKK